MKRWIAILFLCIGAAKLCQSATDGFTIAKISPLLLEEPNEPFDPSLLERRFHYLTKGGQCYAFLSEDGNLVLKLFRGSKLLNQRLLQRTARVEEEAGRLFEAMHGYVLANRQFRKETGIEALHLGEGPCPPLLLVDKLGIVHRLEASSLPFVIQRRAKLVHEKFNEWMAEGDLEAAKRGIDQLFTLLEKRIELGIEDGDPNLAKNFGFHDGEAIEIDAGRFSINAPTFERIDSSKEDMHNWLSENHPELAPYFENAYQTWKESRQ